MSFMETLTSSSKTKSRHLDTISELVSLEAPIIFFLTHDEMYLQDFNALCIGISVWDLQHKMDLDWT